MRQETRLKILKRFDRYEKLRPESSHNAEFITKCNLYLHMYAFLFVSCYRKKYRRKIHRYKMNGVR